MMMSRKAFLGSVAEARPYLSYRTNSSGKHSFYISPDRRFIFKTEPQQSITFFLKILE